MRFPAVRKGWVLIGTWLLLSGCAPVFQKGGDAIVEPTLSASDFITSDGARLAYRKWVPTEKPPVAVLLAIHGFNDYSNYFKAPGEYLAEHFAIASYAIDQRGFGQSPPEPGAWAGAETYANDVKSAISALKKEHPELPVYAIGTSMGGGVVMIAMTDEDRPKLDGIILSAPAVWGRVTMPWYQRLALWIGAHTLPNFTLSGRGLKIKPSDNTAMLIELGKDPLVIKDTRIGTIFGLVNLMDLALERSAKLDGKALILYGANDEIIPKRPTALMLGQLPKDARVRQRIALYQKGYHMLLRDLQRETVWRDIGSWIIDGEAPLPSGADKEDLSSLSGKS